MMPLIFCRRDKKDMLVKGELMICLTESVLILHAVVLNVHMQIY